MKHAPLCALLAVLLACGCDRSAGTPPAPFYLNVANRPGDWSVEAVPFYHLKGAALHGTGMQYRARPGRGGQAASGDKQPAASPAVLVRCQVWPNEAATPVWPDAARLALLRSDSPTGPYTTIATIERQAFLAVAPNASRGKQPARFFVIDPSPKANRRYYYRLSYQDSKKQPIAESGSVAAFALPAPSWSVERKTDAPDVVHWEIDAVDPSLFAVPPRWTVTIGQSFTPMLPLDTHDFICPGDAPPNVVVGVQALCRLETWTLKGGARQTVLRLKPGEGLLSLRERAVGGQSMNRERPFVRQGGNQQPFRRGTPLTAEERKARQRLRQAGGLEGSILITAAKAKRDCISLNEQRMDAYGLAHTLGAEVHPSVVIHDPRTDQYSKAVGWGELELIDTPGKREYVIGWDTETRRMEARISAVGPPLPGELQVSGIPGKVALSWPAIDYAPEDWTEGPFFEIYRCAIQTNENDEIIGNLSRANSYEPVYLGPATTTEWVDVQVEPEALYGYVLVVSGLAKGTSWNPEVGTYAIDIPIFAPQTLPPIGRPLVVKAGGADTPTAEVFPPKGTLIARHSTSSSRLAQYQRQARPAPSRPADEPTWVEESRIAPPVTSGFDLYHHWVHDYGSRFCTVADLAAGSDQAFYVVGAFRKRVDFDPGPGEAFEQAIGDVDAFVSKLDRTGAHLWTRRLGGSDTDIAARAVADGRGGLYVAGGTLSRDFQSDAGEVTPTEPRDAIFLSHFTADGNLSWTRFYKGVQVSSPRLALDASGRILMAGTFTESVQLGDKTHQGSTNISTFVAKLDQDGTPLWSTSFGGPGSVGAYDLGEDARGRIWVSGMFVNVIDFDPGEGENTQVAPDKRTYVSVFDKGGTISGQRSV